VPPHILNSSRQFLSHTSVAPTTSRLTRLKLPTQYQFNYPSATVKETPSRKIFIISHGMTRTKCECMEMPIIRFRA